MYINNNPDFYPTPEHIISKMLEGLDFHQLQTFLEPSAGSGNIAERINEKIKHSRNRWSEDKTIYDIDCIEKDTNLQHIIKGKRFRLIHDDFLTFNTFKKYDAIIMNPPFSEGDKHLLKAIDIQKDGGIIICLLNAETLKNPYSNTRKVLIQQLEEHNAEIEYIHNAFSNAERKTDVEIALIKINIPAVEKSSTIYDDLRKAHDTKQEQAYFDTDVAINDFIKAIVQQYNFECELGIKLINEFNFLSKKMLRSFEKGSYGSTSSILSLSFDEYKGERVGINEFVKRVRRKYWRALFENKNFTGLLTDNLQREYSERVEKLIEYDFTEYNILSIKLDMNKNIIQGVEQTILDLFEKYSNTHSWYDEMSKNIHYFNGWKTNKAYKVGKKVIMPYQLNIKQSYKYVGHDRTYYTYIDGEKQKLIDTEKVFNYLDGEMTEDISIEEALEKAGEIGQSSKIKCKYFNVTFYKKGTCHIKFTNMDLLHKFNLYGAQRKGWLPPSYAKKQYKDMTSEEKEVITQFEGETSYNNVMKHKDYYIVESNSLLMLETAI